MKTSQCYTILLLAISVLACNPIAQEGWEKGGRILYIHTIDPSLVILRQSYLSGAWDGQNTYRTIAWDLDADTAYTKPIDTFNAFLWCPMAVKIQDWDSWVGGLYPLGVDALKSKTDLKFEHEDLVRFDSLLLDKSSYPEIIYGNYLFGRQQVSDDFYTYIVYSGGGLVLQTFTPEFESIQKIELTRTKVGADYYYHKSAEFTSRNTFNIVKEYTHYTVLEQGNVVPGGTTEVRFTTSYRIKDDGKVVRTDDEPFGSIEIL